MAGRKKIFIKAFAAQALWAMLAFPAAAQTGPAAGDEVDIIYDSTEQQNRETVIDAGVFGIFDNPALASGLASGADALNNSVTTLMDSIFYDLLDNEFKVEIPGPTHFSFLTHRQVHDTPDGKYVIVDTLGLGPRYQQKVYERFGIPVNLNLETTGQLIHIYLRTDGSRLGDRHRDSTTDFLLKNWFGILPGLTMVLPPAFNPNEMYDPFNFIKIGFRFPTNKAAFQAMDVGSIMSYSLSGGIRLPLNFEGKLGRGVREEIAKIEGLNPTIAYTLYLQGQHRVNIMRKGENTAWVGVSRVNSVGHGLGADLSSSFFLLENTLPLWQGVPLKLIPVGLELNQARNFKFDLLYEFDLNNREGLAAYESAVLGDFSKVRWARDLRPNDPPPSESDANGDGIFHFSKDESELENSHVHTQNFLAASYRTRITRSASEINITDQVGRFYLLKARQVNTEEWGDVLLGKESESVLSEAYINVDRRYQGDDYTYVFTGQARPYHVQITYQIQDRNTDSLEYDEYRRGLRSFTQLSLAGTPEIPVRDPDFENSLRRRQLLFPPASDGLRVNKIPMSLGKFFATANLYFDHATIKAAAYQPDDVIWDAFASAFGLDPAPGRGQGKAQVQAGPVAGDGGFLRWTAFYAAWPLQFLNIRFPWTDAVAEVSRALEALRAVRGAADPLELRDAFFDLFNTRHPEKFAAALTNLAGPQAVGRSVLFSTSSRGNAPRKYRDAFQTLDNKIIKIGRIPTDTPREQEAIKKLERFQPQGYQERSDQPQISRVVLSNRKVLSLADANFRNLHLNIHCRRGGWRGRGFVYLKLEQAGKVQLGKLHLFEDTVELEKRTTDLAGADGDTVFSVYLQGPSSPVASYMSDYAFNAGGTFRLVLAVSPDGNAWSESKSVEFGYRDGKLVEMED